MNKVVLVFLFMLILGACAPVNLSNTIYPIKTRLVIPTATFAPTETNTVMPKPTLTYTPIPTYTSTPDYSNPGNPPTKSSYAIPNFWPSSLFSFDIDNYDVYSKDIHGTEVIIVIHKDTNSLKYSLPEKLPPRNEFVEFFYSTFILYWDIFQGYPYDKFYVKVLSPQDTLDFFGATAIGFPIVTNPNIAMRNIFVTCKYPCPSGYKQYVTHEMFHAWIGETVISISNHINRIDPEMWFTQGVTQYYGYRGKPTDIELYDLRINDSWDRYTQWIGSKYDIAITDMSKYYNATGEWEYYQNVSEKGACLFYLIDQELIGQGKSLDNLMKFMYENFGLKGIRFTSNDILVALNTITNSDWTDFFKKYVFGIEPLPLDGNFEYLNH